MLKNNSFILFLPFFVSLLFFNTFAQEVNIVPYLKKIEDGKKESVQSVLPGLMKENPNDPSVMFLDGVLTENGQQAIVIYDNIIKNYPHSRYADAALYRVYSYYYALGMYSAAKDKLNKLRKDYPNSPYIKIAQIDIPGKDNVIASGKFSAIPETQINTSVNSTKPDVNYKYTIQAGAFSVLKNATALQKSFQSSGYSSNIKDKIVAGTTFHIVYVGKFTGEDDAKKTLQLINSKFNLNGRVTTTNQ